MIRSLAAAIAISVVTATVTFAQPAGTFRAVLTNLDTGNKHPYQPKTWPGQYQCDAAIKGLDQWLKDIVGPPDSVTREATEADPALKNSLERLVVSILMNTGKMPRLSLSCELAGDPV